MGETPPWVQIPPSPPYFFQGQPLRGWLTRQLFPYRSRHFCHLARSWRALQNGAFPLFQAINRVPEPLRDAVRVTPRDLDVTRIIRRGRVAQQVSHVVLVNIRRPESCGEGVPEIVEVGITDPGLLDRPLEADHQLTPFSTRPPRVEDQLLVGRVPQRSQILSRIPLINKLMAKVKAMVLKRQYHSHDFGMVGFIKELIDELGMKDITNPEFGISPHRQSKFREMRISPSHLFIFKS